MRLLDALSAPKDIVDRAIKLGIDMIGISEHESLSSHIILNKYAQEIKSDYPNFKIALGNEIYLTENRDSKQKYYHFLLCAKDAVGHQMLREASSIAWINSYFDRGMQRVPLLYEELAAIIKKYGHGHLIASSACIGSLIGQQLLIMRKAEKIGDEVGRKEAHDKIVKHVLFCKEQFKDDFYFEIAPATYKDQVYVNQKTLQLCEVFDVKATIQDDSHRLTQNDFIAHKALLNSKQGEREDIDSFYGFTWLQSYDEIRKHMEPTKCDVDQLFKNSMEMYYKVEEYSLLRPQQVPQVFVPEYPKVEKKSKYKFLNQLYSSDNPQERYWVNYCVDKLKEKGLDNDEYLSELDSEANVQLTIGKALGTCIFSYPIFLQHYFDLIWECGGCIGTGRGCFVPDSKVLMANGQTKNIQDIKINDYVYSKDGISQRVENIFAYNCNEELYVITPQTSTGQSITCTNNHEFWVMEGGECGVDRKYCSLNCKRQCSKKRKFFQKKWKKAKDLTLKDYIFYPRCHFKPKEIQKIDLKDFILEESHYLVKKDTISSQYGTIKPFNRYITIDEDFMYLLGVSIGDGWTKKDLGHFGIAFNSSTEKDLASLKRCVDIIDSYGLKHTETKHAQKNLIQLKIYNKCFANFMRTLIGENSETKKIPDFALYDKKQEMISLLKGLLASDGSYDKTSLKFSYDSINYNLISQVKQLLSYLGIYSSIVTRRAHGPNKESYKLRAGGQQLNDWLSILPQLYQKKSSIQRDLIITEEGFYFKIKDIQQQRYIGKVYDLQIANHHSYIINQVGVHNSSSAGLDNYLMNLTQYDPIKAGVNNYFRYLNKERYELPDLDFDLPPTVRPKWFKRIREERGELGLIQVCTFSTMSSRAAILSACRGYRSEDYPSGIDNDEAQYLTSLVGQQRGFTYTIEDMINGNVEKDLKPNKQFLTTVNQYPGLLDIIKKLEGTVSNRSIHASGCVFNEKEHEFDMGAIMTAPDGTLITQWSLHDEEAAGFVKIDALVTDIMEKITQCILILQEQNIIESKLSLREAYDKYVHPDVLPVEDPKIWDAIDDLKVHQLFQFATQVGGQAVQKLRPRNVNELSAINALIRLMAQEKGGETPVDRYYRIQQHPEQWDDEMNKFGLSESEKNIIKEYCGHTYGTLPLQDDLMLMMMDKRLFGFDLAAANSARKIIGKKLMNKIPELHKQVLEKAKSPALGKYIWEVLFSQELGYAFNKEHTYSYSLIGVQCAYLATYFDPIYWNTACLRVDAGLEEDASTNYNKIAKAVGEMIYNKIPMSLMDINKSGYMFEPDIDSGSIIYGMKAASNINGEIIQEITENRPYNNLQDFQEKVKANKRVMISLIKGGAFDQFANREEIMRQYIWSVCEPKKRITLQNFNGLMERNLLPQELDWEKRLFIFNKALRKYCKHENYYLIKDNFYNFYSEFFDIDLLEPCGDSTGINQDVWKKLYTKGMDKARAYFKAHHDELLEQLNNTLFQEMWNKYAEGSLSDWEMDSLGFYYHDHPLKNIDKTGYGISIYATLPENPVVEYTFKRKGIEIPIFKTTRLCGTVIAKDDTKSCISLLTADSGVVTVKMNRDNYARLNRQISEIQPDGTKKVKEKSWFQRGTKLVVNGFRRQNMFFTKRYSRTKSHQVYKINKINSDGSVEMTHLRWGELDE